MADQLSVFDESAPEKSVPAKGLSNGKTSDSKARGSIVDKSTLQASLPARELWVFGYGSLIWQPGFPFIEQRLSLVRGFHRSACLASVCYRGTPSHPGLVVALEHGGSCKGVAFRIAACDAAASMDYLWQREMITQAYHPRMLAVTTASEASGRSVSGAKNETCSALAFTVDRRHPQYRGGLDFAAKIAMISTAQGTSGPNLDYFLEMATHLRRLGIRDRHLERLISGISCSHPIPAGDD